MKRMFGQALCFCAMSFYFFPVMGFEIAFDPQGYAGGYRLDGQSLFVRGPHQMDLDAGDYAIVIGAVSTARFSVDDAGQITDFDAKSLVVSGHEIQFVTAPVNIDVGLYSGDWDVSLVTGKKRGSHKGLLLVVAQDYYFHVASKDGFQFSVDAAGQLILPRGTSSADVLRRTLELRTAPVDIRAGAYRGQWRLQNIFSLTEGDIENLSLVVGLDYQVQIGAVGGFRFGVGPDGQTVSYAPASAWGEDATLFFKTRRLGIVPVGWGESWRIPSVLESQAGGAVLQLVPGLRYQVRIDAYDSSVIPVDEVCESLERSFSVGDVEFGVFCEPPVFVP